MRFFPVKIKQLPTIALKRKLIPIGASNSLHTNLNSTANTYLSVLKSCAHITELRQLHAQLLVTRANQNIVLATRLVNMYAQYGGVEEARLVFDGIQNRNVFLWNAIIRGYVKHGFCKESLELYYQMHEEGIEPDNHTFPFVLKACAELLALEEGKGIHYEVVRRGLESDMFVGSALIHMYAKCRSMNFARQVFDKMSKRDLVSWTALVTGYSQNGQANEALGIFHQMHLAGLEPDAVTAVSVLRACADMGALKQGKWIHEFVAGRGLELRVFVGTALIDMYAKCGAVDVGRDLFDRMPERNVISWNAMIAGYVGNGCHNEGLALFRQMQFAGVTPDSATVVTALLACTNLGALEQGKWIHDYVIRGGFGFGVAVSTSLIDMYGKCGSIDAARQLFDRMSNRNVVSWSSMIAGYGMHGQGYEALALFTEMRQTGMKPNHITFVCVLSACSHAGMVEEGLECFDCMSRDYSIEPSVEHYACMVDLLGRAGRLDDAHDFIRKMPIEPNDGVWGALLGACRIHCDLELGERVAEHLLNVKPKHAGYYVLLSNIYAEAGRRDGVVKVRTAMKDRGVKKPVGCSFIEINKQVHAFVVGDKSHPQSERIFLTLDTLARQMEETGYVPNTNFVLHDILEEAKKQMSHSLKLAIAF